MQPPQGHLDSDLREIRLSAVWRYAPTRPIGLPGGFGEVFEGYAEDGSAVAVKKIRVATPGLATGEIRVAKHLMTSHPDHVIPILDAGFDLLTAERFIVMPRAELSLQELLDSGGALSDPEAMTILEDVLLALTEIGDIVHGDLKPANVLRHEGRWKLADMGIARLAAELPVVSEDRLFATEAYAAPEQWRFEPATAATDIYAFGCLAYAVLTGAPPFPGPTQADYCAQHLEESPRALTAAPAVQTLIGRCLSKTASARPSAEAALDSLRLAWRRA